MDVIQAANEQMVAVRGEFEGMHDLCRRAGDQGKLLFDAYPRLRIVNRARKNLERTLKEVRSDDDDNGAMPACLPAAAWFIDGGGLLIAHTHQSAAHTRPQVTYFSNLPARVDHLVTLLETQPLQLRQVYLEGQQLELWRDELLRELKVCVHFGMDDRVSSSCARSHTPALITLTRSEIFTFVNDRRSKAGSSRRASRASRAAPRWATACRPPSGSTWRR